MYLLYFIFQIWSNYLVNYLIEKLIDFASKLVSRCSNNSLKSNQMFLYLLKNNKKMIIPANAKKSRN
ncbi:MAG: hypothetical protein CFE22_13280 [Cytophagaceae bacterium BCCC1]|nr:MAG: hypothetical protein CFE22_13280 [Cytophagaceae bacterium BCCC1]